MDKVMVKRCEIAIDKLEGCVTLLGKDAELQHLRNIIRKEIKETKAGLRYWMKNKRC